MDEPKSLFKHPDFLKFWSADTISFFGGQFSGLAIPWVAVTTLQANPSQLGLLGALAFVAFPLFALWVGVWVDRNFRRRIMIASNVGRALLLGTIPAAALLGGLSMNILYVVGFVVGTLQVFFDVPTSHTSPPWSKGQNLWMRTASSKRAGPLPKWRGQA